jgi:hypothetical protein
MPYGSSLYGTAVYEAPTYNQVVDASPTVADKGPPKYHWKIGEASGATRIVDRKGNYPVNLLKNGPTLGVAGIVANNGGDTAAQFTGGTAQNFYDDGTPPPRLEATWSLVAWITPQSTGAVQELVCWDFGYPNQFCGLELDATLHPSVWRHDAPEAYPQPASASALTAGQTYRITGRFDGATQSLRVNGVTVASLASATAMYASAAPAIIFGTDAGNGKQYLGVLDEVAWYDYAISDAKDLAEYNAGLSTSTAWDPGTRAETITVTEGVTVSRGIFLSVPDTLTLVEGIVPVQAIDRQVADTSTIAEGVALGPGLSLADASTIAESVTPAAGKGATIPDTSTIAETVAFDQGKVVAEASTIAEATSFDRGVVLADASTIAESAATAAGKGVTINDPVGIAESVTPVQVIQRTVPDTSSIAEALAFDQGKSLADASTVAESVTPAQGHGLRGLHGADALAVHHR